MADLNLKQLWEIEDFETLTDEDKVRLLKHRAWTSLINEPENYMHRQELAAEIEELSGE